MTELTKAAPEPATGDQGRDIPRRAAAAAPAAIGGRRLPALLPAAVDLLNNLPADQSLQETARRFPHVVNGLVKHWNDSRELARAIDALLTDDRNGRAGFPMAVLLELASIREWRVTVLRNVRR